MRKLLLALLTALAALGVFFYFRPLTVFDIGRSIYLRLIGVEHHDVMVGKHRIHYLTIGEGPPLLLVHGIASRAEDSALILRALSKTHRVYAIDLLGFGDSDKPVDSDYSVATQAEIVRGFMDAIRLPRADVMGMSLGGWITLKLAADHPERIEQLVLVSSAGLAFETTLTEGAFSPANLDELRATLAMQTDRAKLLPEFVLRDFLRNSKAKRWIVIRSIRSALSRRHLLDRKLQRVTMPVLLVWGTDDRVIPFSVAAKLQREIPHAQLVSLRGCGHLAIIECRDDAVPPISRFLAQR